MDAATRTEHLTFGSLARALNPRAAIDVAARTALVTVDGSALSSAERAALGALTPIDGGELRCALGDVERIAAACPAGAVVADAIANASAPLPAVRLMGIVNVTPDSFSDGGQYAEAADAIAHGRRLLSDGADLLDIGGESTRPGAEPVAAAEELARVLPVIEGLRALEPSAVLSIDTTKAAVAERAIAAGATIVNDISAGQSDPAMLALVAELGVRFIGMHKRGRPADMQADPRYADVIGEVTTHLRERVAACVAAGIAPERIQVDPGIGFGKRLEHNLALLGRLGELRSLGLPLVVGVSRKSFISHITGSEDPTDFRGLHRTDQPNQRIGGSIAGALASAAAGAAVLRVHDVRTTREALEVSRAIASAARSNVRS